MEKIDWPEMSAMRHRLKLVIDDLVIEHRVAGDILTWRLLHEIEDKAFAHIESVGDIDSSFMGMFKSRRLMEYKRTDEPVDFGESNAIPMAFWYIKEAFKRLDA